MPVVPAGVEPVMLVAAELLPDPLPLDDNVVPAVVDVPAPTELPIAVVDVPLPVEVALVVPTPLPSTEFAFAWPGEFWTREIAVGLAYVRPCELALAVMRTELPKFCWPVNPDCRSELPRPIVWPACVLVARAPAAPPPRPAAQVGAIIAELSNALAMMKMRFCMMVTPSLIRGERCSPLQREPP